MGGTLIVWKAPHPENDDDAARLLAGYHATGDESAFERSPDVGAFYDEVLGRWPPRDGDGGVPTWSSTPERSDRVVSLDYAGRRPASSSTTSTGSLAGTSSSSTTRRARRSTCPAWRRSLSPWTLVRSRVSRRSGSGP